MRPILPQHDSVYELERNSEKRSNSTLADSRCVKLPDGQNISFFKPVPPMLLANNATAGLAALCAHIVNVVDLSTDEQMRWTNAGRNVAFMEDAHTERDGGAGKNPRAVMSLDIFYSRYAPTDDSVPVELRSPRPHPTRSKFWSMLRRWSVFVHLRPKAFWEGWGKALRGQILGSNLDHSFIFAPFGLLDRRGSFIMGNSTTGGN